MSLESGRSMIQGILILAFAAIAVWVSSAVGPALVALMGFLKLQEAATD